MGQVKFAIVGCGRVSSRHVDALSKKVPGANIVAVCDRVKSRAEKCGFGLGVPAYTNLDKLCADVDVDVIDVATPSGDHYPRVMQALSLNKHVVVEKPIALRLEHVDDMTREARSRNLKLWVIHQNRYNPPVVEAKHCLDSGRLGKLVEGTVRVRWFRDQSYYSQDDWHGTWAMDGGVISQQAIHHVDALRWFMGEVESVEARCETRLVDMECEDICVATLRFKNGALGVIEGMTAARPRDMEASLSIMGERGTIILGGLAMNEIDFWEFTEPQPEDSWVPELFSQDVPNAYGFGHDVLFSRVVESVLQNAPIEIPAEEGRKALEILHAVYASHELGRRVSLDEGVVSMKLGVMSAKGKSGARSWKRKTSEAARSIQSLVTNKLDPSGIKNACFAGIIGDQPSKYAKSPWIWNQTFQRMGIDASFLSFDVKSRDLGRLVETLRGCENFWGGSVTVPYKIDIIEHLDNVDPMAERIGAVNTIARSSDGTLSGFNTDAKGGVDCLLKTRNPKEKPFLKSLKNMKATLIGAGGAARAMAFYLADSIGPKGKLTIVNRTAEKAKALADDVNRVYGNTVYAQFESLRSTLPKTDLLVNATRCGQSGLVVVGKGGRAVTLEPFSPLAPAEPPSAVVRPRSSPEKSRRSVAVKAMDAIRDNNAAALETLMNMNAGAAVFDIVYSPLDTVFLKHARLSGLRTVGGKGMNICQAAESMFNLVCANYFQERGIWNDGTYRRILNIMHDVW